MTIMWIFLFGFLCALTVPVAAEQKAPNLAKACLDLDDLYQAYVNNESTTPIPSFFRETIQFFEQDDTAWVKVVVTVDQKGADVGRLNGIGLRGISQFGSIITALVPVERLPHLDILPFVTRIEPVSPSGQGARTTVSRVNVESGVKKK